MPSLLGLTCHPSRPFTMASCSRDSTVRLWSLTPLINPLQINILADRGWDEIIGNTGKYIVYTVVLIFCMYYTFFLFSCFF